MGLIDKLRNVSQRAGSAAHDGFAKVRHGWGDAEQSLRQRMRIYPQRPKLWGSKAGEMGEPLIEHIEADDMAVVVAAAEKPVEANRPPRNPIVSINGRDVDGKRLDRDVA